MKTFTIFAATFLTCCSSGQMMEPVSIGEYVDAQRCWLDSATYTSAFVVFAEARGTAIPYFVSTKCYVKGYTTPGDEMVDMLGAYKIGSTAAAFDKYTGLRVTSNTPTDQPAPEGNAEIYFFVGDLQQHSSFVHEVHSVVTFRKTGVRFDAFLMMPYDQRGKLARDVGLR